MRFILNMSIEKKYDVNVIKIKEEDEKNYQKLDTSLKPMMFDIDIKISNWHKKH